MVEVHRRRSRGLPNAYETNDLSSTTSKNWRVQTTSRTRPCLGPENKLECTFDRRATSLGKSRLLPTWKARERIPRSPVLTFLSSTGLQLTSYCISSRHCSQFAKTVFSSGDRRLCTQCVQRFPDSLTNTIRERVFSHQSKCLTRLCNFTTVGVEPLPSGIPPHPQDKSARCSRWTEQTELIKIKGNARLTWSSNDVANGYKLTFVTMDTNSKLRRRRDRRPDLGLCGVESHPSGLLSDSLFHHVPGPGGICRRGPRLMSW